MKRNILTLILIAGVSMALQAEEPSLRLVGGDISLLPSYEQYNTPYKDKDGKKIDDLVSYAATTLGWNACRVRLFVNPCIINPDNNKRQGEVQDLEYVTALGKRIKEAGMFLLLDFHYSDTWADPLKQVIPTAWQSLSEEQLYDTMYTYTRMCLRTMVDAGATPDYVQIGNEISYGMLLRGKSDKSEDRVYPRDAYDKAPTQWGRFCGLLNQGAKAVREVCPYSKIIIHIERTGDKQACVQFYQNMATGNVDYDIIGLSYYPFWHGRLTTELPATLIALHEAHPDKPIQIVETAYYNNYWPSSGISYDTRDKYPATPEGQDAFLTDLITRLKYHDYVNGLYYWFPEENGNGGASYDANKIVIDTWLNRGLFDPNTHKAYAGLYRLGEYSGLLSGTDALSLDNGSPLYHTLLGVPMGTDKTSLPAGIYIHNGKKEVILR